MDHGSRAWDPVQSIMQAGIWQSSAAHRAQGCPFPRPPSTAVGAMGAPNLLTTPHETIESSRKDSSFPLLASARDRFTSLAATKFLTVALYSPFLCRHSAAVRYTSDTCRAHIRFFCWLGSPRSIPSRLINTITSPEIIIAGTFHLTQVSTIPLITRFRSSLVALGS